MTMMEFWAWLALISGVGALYHTEQHPVASACQNLLSTLCAIVVTLMYFLGGLR